MNTPCRDCQQSPGFHAGLHVGHVWTAMRCRAYFTLNGADCTCIEAHNIDDAAYKALPYPACVQCRQPMADPLNDYCPDCATR
jgi:hypothetical protein